MLLRFLSVLHRVSHSPLLPLVRRFYTQLTRVVLGQLAKRNLKEILCFLFVGIAQLQQGFYVTVQVDESRHEDDPGSRPVLRAEAEALGHRIDVPLTEEPKTCFALGSHISVITFCHLALDLH